MTVGLATSLHLSCSPQQEDTARAESDSVTAAYCILNAHTDQGTFHFEGPNWLLTSAEGWGPQQLFVRVFHYVQPVIATSDRLQPNPAGVSKAVGYSLSEFHEVISGTGTTLKAGVFQRVEAYASFQRTIWEIRDASCTTPLGIGASYKPTGAYFKVVDAGEVALPDPGLFVFQTQPDVGTVMVPAVPPVAARPPGGPPGPPGPPEPQGNSGFGAQTTTPLPNPPSQSGQAPGT